MMVITMILVNIFPSLEAIASTLQLDETGYNYTGISFTNGNKLENKVIWNMKMDGQDVFCIDSGAPANTEAGYVSEEYFHEKKVLLSKIAYYGFTQTEQSYKDFATTQLLIWEVLGEDLKWTSLPNYWSDKESILAKIKKHDTQPSWDKQTITLIEGQELVLDDTNKVADWLSITNNKTEISVAKDGNKLKLKADKNAKSGEISFAKVPDTAIGISIIYNKLDRQSLVDFHLQDAGNAQLKVNVKKLGGVKIKKIDEQTKQALPNTTIQFEYNGISKEIVTDGNGIAELKGIPEGAEVTVTELVASQNYYNNGQKLIATIKPNEMLEFIFNNTKQQGTIKLSKVGQKFGADMPNDNYSLQGATYGIYDSTDARVGELVTDDFGKATSVPLALGKYYLLEEQAPHGYLISKEKIPFKIEYTEQDVAVTNIQLQATDVEQKGTAKLVKEDAETGVTAQGNSTLDGAVYELFRASDDTLVDTVTIENGQAQVENLLLDDYYWIEKQAPTGYLLDKEKHEFSLKYDINVTTVSEKITVQEKVIKEKIKIIKYDDKTKKPIKNNPATFKLKDVQTGKFVEQDGKSEFSTNMLGEFTIGDLPYGDYELVEVIAPTNYQLRNKSIPITVDGTHDGMIEVRVMNNKIPEPLPKKVNPKKKEPVKVLKITESKPLPLLGDTGGVVILLLGLGLITTSLSIYWSINKKQKN